MVDPAIQNFLDERRTLWLKGKIKGKLTDEEEASHRTEAAARFSLAEWLPHAAKRAGQLSLVSHPGKFSHPSAQVSSIRATTPSAPDGYLRSGNVAIAPDVLGNAAALDVYAFLCVELADGKTVLAHLEEKSAYIHGQLQVSTASFATLEEGLLAIKEDADPCVRSSAKVKQVYFPVAKDSYHLLSILTPSPIVFALKERILSMHFSEQTKEVRAARNNNKSHPLGFSEVYGLTVMGRGGTKPQNISFLNSRNGGAAYLLPSLPPGLSPRTVSPPTRNFFRQSLWWKMFEEDFMDFHNLLKAKGSDVYLRRQRDRVIRSIIYQVADQVWRIRNLEGGWSEAQSFVQLPHYQKVLLDQYHAADRAEQKLSFEELKSDLARWFMKSYRQLLKEKAIPMGDDELPHIKTMIVECEDALW